MEPSEKEQGVVEAYRTLDQIGKELLVAAVRRQMAGTGRKENAK